MKKPADVIKNTEVLKRTGDGWEKVKPQEPHGDVFDYYMKEVWAKGLSTGLPEVLATLLGIQCLKDDHTTEVHHGCCEVQEVTATLKGQPKALWWNPKLLNLVVSDGDTNVGVSFSQLKVPLHGLNWANVETLYQGLKQALVTH
jgi:hypothetical protein